MRPRIVPYVVALGVAAYLVRLLGAPWPRFPSAFPDSSSFIQVARTGPFHPAFYFDQRPIGFPLLAWVVGRSSTLIVVAQSLLYVGAFTALGCVLARDLSSRVVAFAAIVFVVVLAIEPRNSLWNTLILSESLSNTCAVLSIAAWFHAAARPSRRAVRAAWLATAAWILVRDPNLVPAAVCIVPSALAIGYVARRRAGGAIARTLMAGAVAAALVCGYVYVAQYSSHRGIYPILDNVGTRILPDPSLTQWFVARGMPIDAAVRGRAGHYVWDDNEAFLRDPQLANIRSWAKGPGGRVLIESLVFQPSYWWHQFHAALPGLLSYRDSAYDTVHVEQRFPQRFPAPLGEPRTTDGLLAGLVLAVGGIALAANDRRRRLLAAFAAVMLGSALLDVYISFAGDSIEIQRHLVGALLRLSITVVVAVAIGADAAVQLMRERGSPRSLVADD